MSKRRKNVELLENLDDLKIRKDELEAEKLILMARIQELEASYKVIEKENRELKENCKCPKVKMFLFIYGISNIISSESYQ